MHMICDLSVSNYGTIRDAQYDVAILPWGATEPHNYHLPYLTDSILSHDIAVDAALKASDVYGTQCMVLPPLALGAQNPGQRDLPFCIHYRYETQKAVLTDIISSLQHQGLNKLVIINGHGGNNFRNMVRDLNVDFPDFVIAVSEWFRVCPAKDYFEIPGDHADEVETSVMMHYHPELVELSQAGQGNSKPFALSTLNEGVAWIPRHWTKVSTDTGIGDPSHSTAEKGKRFACAVTDRYALLLHQLASGDIYLD
nr:creatininase family protein [Porphyromonas pogonae]